MNIQELLNLVWQVDFGSMLANCCMMPTGQCFSKDKDAACFFAGIVTILYFWLSRFHRHRISLMIEQLVLLLIHAGEWIGFIIGLLI